jgi:hypothetical protein
VIGDVKGEIQTAFERLAGCAAVCHECYSKGKVCGVRAQFVYFLTVLLDDAVSF